MLASELELLAALTIELKQRIGEPRYDLWFENKTKFSLHSDRLIVGVPNRFYQDWLEKTFSVAIVDVCRSLVGKTLAVDFTIDPALFQSARNEQSAAQEASDKPERPKPVSAANNHVHAAHSASGPKRPRKRRWRQLSDFIVGPCNRVGHAAAMSVVETPDMCPTPLVLYGPTGVGKTHLLEGVYSELRKRYPEWRVCFITAEQFTHRYVQAMRFDKVESFRKQYRECDVFLLDDLDYMETKRGTQNELLHTLDVLQAEQCPVVVTCDCHPRLAEQYGPDLTDRLIGGTAWELALPDVQTRRALLQAKVVRTLFSDEVVDFLAQNLTGNVRELEGALNTLKHYQRVHGGQLDVIMAKEALRDLLHPSAKQVELADIQDGICQTLALDKKALQSKKRDWQVSHPRMVAMYLARKHTGVSYSEIGRFFGKRNHSTVVAACKKITKWLESQEQMVVGGRKTPVADVIARVERGLKSG